MEIEGRFGTFWGLENEFKNSKNFRDRRLYKRIYSIYLPIPLKYNFFKFIFKD